MQNPKINIPDTLLDHVLETLALMGLIALVGLPIVYYSSLPDTIPIHYSIDGKPDGYGSRMSLGILSFVGLLLYTGLTYLNRFPHTFNYKQEITPQNGFFLYQNALRMNRTIKFLICWALSYIVWRSIQTGLGQTVGLSPYFLPVFVLLLLGTIAFFYWQRKALS